MEYSKPAESNYTLVPPHHIRRASTESLKRAARHYKRTLAIMRGHPFEHMPASMRQDLMDHLSGGLHVVERELRRRGLKKDGELEGRRLLSRSLTGENAYAQVERNEQVASGHLQSEDT